MSGGHFDYTDCHFGNIARSIEQLIETNETSDEYGYARDYPKKILDKFELAAAICWAASFAVHEIDWLVSDDTGKDQFLKNWKSGVEPKLRKISKKLKKKI